MDVNILISVVVGGILASLVPAVQGLVTIWAADRDWKRDRAKEQGIQFSTVSAELVTAVGRLIAVRHIAYDVTRLREAIAELISAYKRWEMVAYPKASEAERGEIERIRTLIHDPSEYEKAEFEVSESVANLINAIGGRY